MGAASSHALFDVDRGVPRRGGSEYNKIKINIVQYIVFSWKGRLVYFAPAAEWVFIIGAEMEAVVRHSPLDVT